MITLLVQLENVSQMPKAQDAISHVKIMNALRASFAKSSHNNVSNYPAVVLSAPLDRSVSIKMVEEFVKISVKISPVQ
jgi:hypothetical protein